MRRRVPRPLGGESQPQVGVSYASVLDRSGSQRFRLTRSCKAWATGCSYLFLYHKCLQLCTPLQGLTPLYQAVEDHNLELVKSILASGGDTHLNSWAVRNSNIT